MFKLHDRIKEKSYTIGSGNLLLSGATPTYSAFSSVYSSGDSFYYCVTNNTDYEIGLGKYIPNYLQRLEIITSSKPSGQIVNWGAGLKEIYVTYPAEKSVLLQNNPSLSGISYFKDSNTIDSVSGITYQNNRINSLIEFIFSDVISFSGYTVKQNAPFRKDELILSTNIDDLIFQSGEVNEFKGLNLQKAGTVFAGPIDNCGSGMCPSGYPSFRPLVSSDIPPIDADKINFLPSVSGNWIAIPSNVEEALNYLSYIFNYINASGSFVVNSGTSTNITGFLYGDGSTIESRSVIDGGTF